MPQKPAYVGSVAPDQEFIAGGKTLSFSDDNAECLALQFRPGLIPDEDPSTQITRAQYKIEPTGSSSKLKITLRVKYTGSSGVTESNQDFVITVASSKTDWSSSAGVAANFKDVVDLINESDTAGGTNGTWIRGFKAWLLHAPYHASVNSDNFIAAASFTDILPGTGSGSYTTCLKRDVSEYTDSTGDKVMYQRIGFPEVRDRNRFQLIDIEGTAAGDTNGVVRLYRDDYEGYTSSGPTDYIVNKALAEAQTSYVGRDRMNASTVLGPCILAVKSDDLSACSIRTHVRMIG